MTEDPRRQFSAQRRRARTVAMQVLFETDFTHRPLDEVLEWRLGEESAEDDVAEYASQLARGAWERRAEYDTLIAEAAPTWPVEQIAPVDRNILRIALHEVLHRNDVPMKAAINEAVELAKEYGSDASRRFVNGVLGTIAARRGDGSQEGVAPQA